MPRFRMRSTLMPGRTAASRTPMRWCSRTGRPTRPSRKPCSRMCSTFWISKSRKRSRSTRFPRMMVGSCWPKTVSNQSRTDASAFVHGKKAARWGPPFFSRVRSLERGKLHEAEFEAGLVRHHVHAPGRVPGEFDIDGPDPGDGRDGIGDPARHLPGHRTARCGEGHDYLDVALGRNVDGVDKPQIVDIHRNLGVEDRAARLHDGLVERMVGARRPDEGGAFEGLCAVCGHLGLVISRPNI